MAGSGPRQECTVRGSYGLGCNLPRRVIGYTEYIGGNHMSEPMIWVGLGILVALILIVGTLPLRRGANFASLEGRLAQLAESQMTAQAQLSERLQAQERALARAVEERLENLGRRVGDSLQKNSELTHHNLADLKTRLAVIETAQKSISELSGQVVGLQE